MGPTDWPDRWDTRRRCRVVAASKERPTRRGPCIAEELHDRWHARLQVTDRSMRHRQVPVAARMITDPVLNPCGLGLHATSNADRSLPCLATKQMV